MNRLSLVGGPRRPNEDANRTEAIRAFCEGHAGRIADD